MIDVPCPNCHGTGVMVNPEYDEAKWKDAKHKVLSEDLEVGGDRFVELVCQETRYAPYTQCPVCFERRMDALQAEIDELQARIDDAKKARSFGCHDDT